MFKFFVNWTYLKPINKVREAVYRCMDLKDMLGVKFNSSTGRTCIYNP